MGQAAGEHGAKNRESRSVALLHELRQRALSLPRSGKQAAMIAYDAGLFCVSAVVATWLVNSAATAFVDLVTLTLIGVVVAVTVVSAFGFYSSIVRFMGVDLFIRGLWATTVIAFVVVPVSSVVGLVTMPLRWGTAYLLVSLVLFVGGRFVARLFLNRQNQNRVPVIVYGAGEGGAHLTSALFSGDDYLPVAMVDDDPSLHGKRVCGLKVYSPLELESLVEYKNAKGVLLAIPSASQRTRRKVLEQLSQYAVHVQTMPKMADLVSGKARVDDVRDVEIADLLTRERVPPDPTLLSAPIAGKRVMVTGAGGSIGSEICRQIIAQEPELLILFELSEYSLYNIERQLRKAAKSMDKPCCEIVSLLGSAHHRQRVSEVIAAFRVQTIYHAAAYKHVPIVEHNIFEGIHNNIFGTLHTAQAAIEAGVENYVLISTDKAVSPTSVMGATKRVAEMVLQALHAEGPQTQFCMVRFGNVLGSSGSVVPLFREQIRHGGPVTVTHRDVIRYFMTIPEAAQLVIQAGAMAHGGEVFVLDMGEPVKIYDLARRMINLMGFSVRDKYNLDGDIEIAFTGLRPGEKLYEELLIGSDVSGTSHPRILRAREDFMPFADLKPHLDDLKLASQRLDRHQASEILQGLVSGYLPKHGIEDLVWSKVTGVTLDGDTERKVIELTPRSA